MPANILAIIFIIIVLNNVSHIVTPKIKRIFAETQTKKTMKIGTITQKRMRTYDLTAQEVYFAELLHAGATQIEAYSLIYPTSTQAPTTAAQNLITTRTGIKQLLNALALTQPTDNRAANKPQTKGKKEKGKGNGTNITTKEGQLDELQAIYNETANVKERADILKQVADLQRLKQEENKGEEQRTHYYLPMKCNLCPYKQQQAHGKDGETT